MMVLAHEPIYSGPRKPDLVPCADGAGIVEERQGYTGGEEELVAATGHGITVCLGSIVSDFV